MSNPSYYRRLERLVLYQVASAILFAAQVLATYCMFKYKALTLKIFVLIAPNGLVDTFDILMSSNLSSMLPNVIGFIFNAELIMLFFWPHKRFELRWRKTKVVLGMLGLVSLGGVAIYSTFVVFYHTATITGLDATAAQEIAGMTFTPPLEYRRCPEGVAWVALLWASLPVSIASLAMMYRCVTQAQAHPLAPVTFISPNFNTSGETMGDRKVSIDMKDMSGMPGPFYGSDISVERR